MRKDGAAVELSPLLLSVFFGFAINLLTAETSSWWGPLRPLTAYPYVWVPASIGAWAAWVWWRRRRTVVTWVSGNPYPGLAAFDKDHESVFCGRDGETAALRERLEGSGIGPAQRFVALVGPSGSGKSSVLQAGLIPAMGSGWQVLGPVLPGNDVFRSLAGAVVEADAAALAGALRAAAGDRVRDVSPLSSRIVQGGRRNTLLVIDQLEEVFAAAVVADAAPFLTLLRRLLEVQPRMHVVAAIRPEYLAAAADAEPALFQQPVPIGPLEPRYVREAIEKPAAAAGMTFETGLVDVMVAEATVGDALPLLGLLLQRLFSEIGDGTVTHTAYKNAGRVPGAIAEQADEVHRRLSSAAPVEATLLRFVSYENGDFVRSRVLRKHLNAASLAVVEEFRQARLLVDAADGTAFQFAHDAVFRQWGTLSEMVSRHKHQLRQVGLLEERASEWWAARSEHDLIRGRTLRQAEACVEALAHSGRLADFLRASRAAENRRLSDRSDRVALAAQDVFAEDPGLATAIVAAAIDEIFPSRIAELTLWGFTAEPGRRRLMIGHAAAVTSGVLCADGSFVTVDKRGRLCRWDKAGSLLETLLLHPDDIESTTAISRDGRYAVLVSTVGAIELHQLAGEKRLHEIGRTEVAAPEALRWIGDTVFTVASASSMEIWKVEGEVALRRLIRIALGPNSQLTWSPDKRFLAVIDNGHMAVWRWMPQPEVVFADEVGSALGGRTVEWSPTSDFLLVAFGDGRDGRVVRVLTSVGQVLAVYRTSSASGIVWSADGSMIREIGADGSSTFRKVVEHPPSTASATREVFLNSEALEARGDPRARWSRWPAPQGWRDGPFPPPGDVEGISWSPGRDRAVTWSRSGPPCIVSTNRMPTVLHTPPRPATHHRQRGSAKWSPSGRLIAGSDGRQIVIWDSFSGAQLRTINADCEGGDLSWSPDSSRIAAARRGFAGYRRASSVSICDVQSGHVLRDIAASTHLEGWVAWSPDGRFIATVDGDDLVTYYADTGDPCRRWRIAHEVVRGLCWSDDGMRLALSSSRRLYIFEPKSERPRGQLDRAVSCFCFHARARWVACRYKEGGLDLWDGDLTQRIATLPMTPADDVRGLRWDDDLVAVTREGAVLTWRLPPPGSTVRATHTTRPLSELERRKFDLPQALADALD
ncbi:nSTAND1 domain-containing NTPase [Symbioplanes lichenis]|uniref:nSTAND1 domain-containing NTPase n=1 Tax=Symbioplanes lichenis TaxID=1629072 RepID=UPI0027388E20|nr:AAA family ATPase [Actinoplanes lichenis]